MTKDIERVEEILSSKEKFLENIWGVKFELRIIDIGTRLIKITNYSAYVIKKELEKFYDRYKSRICDKLKLEIRYVEQADILLNQGCYLVRLEKIRGHFLYTAEMMLLPYFNGGQE